MIQLLFSLILGQVVVVLTLLFKTPLRKLVILSLDRLKRGRGPVVVKTVAGTLFALFSTTVYSFLNVQHRTDEAGVPNPTDQVLSARHLLECTLLGLVLFLALMIDRLHYYIRELRLLRKTMEAAKKQNRGFEEGKTGKTDERKALEEEIAALKTKIKDLESDCKARATAAKDAQAETEALKKQSEGLLMEYDRQLEDNQNLRNQLESIGKTSSEPDGGKNI